MSPVAQIEQELISGKVPYELGVFGVNDLALFAGACLLPFRHWQQTVMSMRVSTRPSRLSDVRGHRDRKRSTDFVRRTSLPATFLRRERSWGFNLVTRATDDDGNERERERERKRATEREGLKQEEKKVETIT